MARRSYFTTSLAYDDAGNLTSTTSPLANTTTTTYNTAGEPTRATDHTGRFTQTGPTTWPAGWCPRSPARAPPTSTRSPRRLGPGRPGRVHVGLHASGAGTCVTTLRTAPPRYDARRPGAARPRLPAGPRPTATTPPGSSPAITQRVDPATPATAITCRLGYDRRQQDPHRRRQRQRHHLHLHTWNLPESTIEPSTTAHPAASDRTWTTIYDAVGLAVQDQLPGGVTRTRTYDKLGRLTGETGTGATTTARTLDYDAVGRSPSASSPAGNLTFTWTDRGLLTSAAGYGGTASYTYDGEANLTSASTPPAPRPSATTAPAASPRGRPADRDHRHLHLRRGRASATVDRGSGNSSRAFTYDNLGRLATDTTKRPNATMSASTAYGYDFDDLLTTKTTAGLTGAGPTPTRYDGLGRVATLAQSRRTTTTYGYDAASNRTTVTTPAGDAHVHLRRTQPPDRHDRRRPASRQLHLEPAGPAHRSVVQDSHHDLQLRRV